MNSTINTRRANRNFRWQLLATVSAAALLASAYSAGEAEAADRDRPQLWIELGGQLDYLRDAQESFNPPFMPAFAQANMLPTINVQSPPRYALDADGQISFQPDSSDWVFSASVQFGRSKIRRHHHQQTKNPYVGPVHFTLASKYMNAGTKYPSQHVRFADASADQSERHIILDFQAGKDVGLGMFGNRGSSILSAGIRYAQFDSKGSVTLAGIPDLQYPDPATPITSFTAFRTQFKYVPVNFHNYTGTIDYKRSFRGVGPALTWTGSLPFAGNLHNGEISLDLGANAALLFGRQKASGHRQTATRSYQGSKWGGQARNYGPVIQDGPHIIDGAFVGGRGVPHYMSGSFNRTRSVTVPNLGGTVGLSYRIEDFKVSLGYRADFFFGAIDGGIDTRKSENRGFFGPFASISVGLGD